MKIPAQGRRQRRLKKRRDPVLFKRIFLAAFFVFAIFAIFLASRTKLWDGKNRLTVVFPREDGGIAISVLSPSGKVTVINVPGDLEVEAARGLGTWKIESLSALGKKEGVEGLLLAETVTKSFGLPIDAWSDKRGLGLTKESYVEVFGALLAKYPTNLTFGDKLRIAMLSLKTRNIERETIDLAKTGYLVKGRLADGEEAYLPSGRMSPYLLSLFAIDEITMKGGRVKVVNSSSDNALAEKIGTIVEVLGAKVVAIEEDEVSNSDCVVKTRQSGLFGSRISKVLGCKVELSVKIPENFLEIDLGEGFLKRF